MSNRSTGFQRHYACGRVELRYLDRWWMSRPFVRADADEFGGNWRLYLPKIPYDWWPRRERTCEPGRHVEIEDPVNTTEEIDIAIPRDRIAFDISIGPGNIPTEMIGIGYLDPLSLDIVETPMGRRFLTLRMTETGIRLLTKTNARLCLTHLPPGVGFDPRTGVCTDLPPAR